MSQYLQRLLQISAVKVGHVPIYLVDKRSSLTSYPVWGLTGGSNALAAAKEEAAKAAALDIAVSDGATTNEKSRHTSVQLTDGSTIVVETLGNGKLLIINEDEEEEEVIGVPVANLPEPELVDFEREEKLAGMLP